MTDKGKAVGKHALTGALAALAGAAATWLLGHATPSPAQASQPTEVAALRTAMDARFDRLEIGQQQLYQRLSHLEGVWDARRSTQPAKAREE